MTRREVLLSLAASPLTAAGGLIDRKALVRRNNPVIREFQARSPLSVGNGEFAFTADLTGLQTFPEVYEKEIPLCTQSQWGWHSFPLPTGRTPEDLVLEQYDTHGRMVGYPTRQKGQEEIFRWLRENPHRLHLGRIGFVLTRADVTAAEQTLDLWTGSLLSSFRVNGSAATVKTCCHPELDMVAVEIDCAHSLAVAFEFPYGSPAVNAADWSKPDAHKTKVTSQTAARLDLQRELDQDSYAVRIAWNGNAKMAQAGPHRFVLTGSGKFSFVCRFGPKQAASPLPAAAQSFTAAQAHWAKFWATGGAVELAGSPDLRAKEFERRIVLSQYLTAIQCSGSVPPAETGLTCNSWYGKFHLEMHWWHAVHFALWDRLPMLERSLQWYQRILPSARDWARRQGYAGARWPKMVGPDGRDSPSPIGPLLIWQQPHPLVYVELCYQSHPNRQTLERYKDIVFATADFMASYAWLNPKSNRYVLGPPVIPAQENHPPRETWNPTYELVYWAHGLGIAQQWRKRLGMPPDPKWEHVRTNLSPLPEKDGVYLAHENCPQTFTERNRDHPSMLAALGVLPGEGVDPETMRRTLHKVRDEWKWPDTWGWDYPMVAMTAARLNEPGLAVEALLLQSPKNVYLPNGHNYQRPGLSLYLPGNGGLLAAVAMMAAKWNGFPKEMWTVRHEGLKPLL